MSKETIFSNILKYKRESTGSVLRKKAEAKSELEIIQVVNLP